MPDPVLPDQADILPTQEGPGLFGDDPASAGHPGPATPYLVLARKYRPRTFDDLIGQEAMVRTLTNAFAMNRIAHAFMLTGVRGVGKTTTARLLARALNHEPGEGGSAASGPSMTLTPLGAHCQAIMESRHPDVQELDAASRTGVGDMRDLLEGVRYSPVSARFKVYIIDEVHMLSMAAFNALLKTLEEPPAHVKFIFATTEIRKVPVTVLSRCQRFDLRRLEPQRLQSHLHGICGREGARVSEDALALIARAAEGSVRDALSLLDQAIVQHTTPDEPVSAAAVRDMLGLADRGRLIDLLDLVLAGDKAGALTLVADLHASGGDPSAILRDLVDLAGEMAKASALGEGYSYPGTRASGERLKALAARLSPAAAERLWRVLLGGLEDLGRAPDGLMALEMTVLRLTVSAGLPPPELAALLMSGEARPVSLSAAGVSPSGAPAASANPGTAGYREPAGSAGGRAGSLAAAPQARIAVDTLPDAHRARADMLPNVALHAARPLPEHTPHHIGPRTDSLADIVRLIAATRERELLYAVERLVVPGPVRETTDGPELEIGLLPGGEPETARHLAGFLKARTGREWTVTVKPGLVGDSLHMQRQKARQESLDVHARDPAVVAVLMAFPGAQLVDVVEDDKSEPEVIPVEFGVADLPDAPMSDGYDIATDVDPMEGFEPDFLPAIPEVDDDEALF